jgi:hypothetical protein
MSPPLGAQGGEAGEADAVGPGIDIPDCMMSPPLGAEGGKAGEADAVGPGIHIPGCMMSPPLGARDGALVEHRPSIDGSTAWRPSVHAGAGSGDPRPTTDGVDPGIDIPGYVMSPREGAQEGAAGGEDSLVVVAMASGPSAVCGGDSVMELEVMPTGGNVAGETSEPNFDENVLTAKNPVAVDVTANSGAFSGLDKRGEGKDASQNPKSEIRNPKGGLEVQGEANVRGATRDRNPARSIEKPEPHGLSERKSKRERRRMRLESERKEVERMVEQLLMAGETSATKIIEKVLAASPRVRGLAGPGPLKRGQSQALAGDDQVDTGRSASCPQTRPP